MRQIGANIFQSLILPPCEGGTEQRQRLTRARRRLEQRMAVSVLLRSIERRYHSIHERQLGAVRLVRELHRNPADVDRVRQTVA